MLYGCQKEVVPSRVVFGFLDLNSTSLDTNLFVNNSVSSSVVQNFPSISNNNNLTAITWEDNRYTFKHIP